MNGKGGVVYSLWMRVAAWILCFIMTALAAASAVSVAVMLSMGFYTSSKEALREEHLSDILRNECRSVMLYYLDGMTDIAGRFEYRNFFFTITREDGTVAESTYSGQQVLLSLALEYNPDYFPGADEYFGYGVTLEGEHHPRTERPFTVTGYIPANMDQVDNISINSDLIDLGFRYKAALWIIGFLSLIAAFVLFIFLLSAAGHRRGREGIVLSPIDRIPLDLSAGLVIIANAFAFAVFIDIYDFWLQTTALIIIFTADFAMFTGFFVSLAARVKAGGALKNTLIWIVISFIVRLIKKLFEFVSMLIQNIPLLWKTILGAAIAFCWVFILIIIGMFNPSTALFLWFLSWSLFFTVALVITMNLIKLKRGGERLASGNLGEKINTSNMFTEFKRHAEALNSIGDGMTLAVEERLKSERFRTELITNVSHDLKTPLTSIINYVDLLKKEAPENEKARSYIEVLDRQASRLRKLTEDLVEASKASTGNISIELAVCELNELLMQTSGEYGERLSAAGLELIIKKPDEAVRIMADGRHLWRVIENLLNNICKYAQPMTRVYINLDKKGNKAEITFKNTSMYALNITSDELMERFVRGDASRHTEGSGLGLSIARSLVELQNGRMSIFIDGDLFKVTLSFDVI